jgi:hypothetical protein
VPKLRFKEFGGEWEEKKLHVKLTSLYMLYKYINDTSLYFVVKQYTLKEF